MTRWMLLLRTVTVAYAQELPKVDCAAQPCVELAPKLRRGDGVPRDAPQSAAMYLALCEKALAQSPRPGKSEVAPCLSYAEMARKGEGLRKNLVVAEHALQRVCAVGDLAACVEEGVVLLEGEPVPVAGLDGILVRTRPAEETRVVLPRDVPRAVALFSSSCAGKQARGCTQLGLVKLRGDEGEKDAAKGVHLLRQACEARDADACQMLGVLYGNRQGDRKQEKAVLATLDARCRAKEEAACYGAGLWHRFRSGKGMEEDGGARHAQPMVNAEAKQAVTLIGRACELGDRRACYDLGLYAERGTFAKANPDEAARRYEQACGAGFGLACYNLGVSWDPATSASQADVVRAESYYRKGCGFGEGKACFNLGYLLLNKAAASAEAVSLFEELCAADMGESCNKLGNLALKGEGGVKRDPAAAIRWYQQACNDGVAMGCGNLGVALLDSQTPPKLRDEKRAHDALTSACKRGYSPSCELLK